MAFNSGFEYQEAVSMLDLCMQLNGTGLKDKDGKVIPPPDVSGKWKLLFDSLKNGQDTQEKLKYGKTGLGPFDNAWQLWEERENGRYVISIRGTIDTVESMLDDVLATTIHANCYMPVRVNGTRMKLPLRAFREGESRNASIHLGFAWGATILLFHKTKGILQKLLELPEGSDIYITGHSQGAAIATLMHSILYHAGDDSSTLFGREMAKKKFSYKSYFFAQPKPGNWQYGQVLSQDAGNKGMSYCINNDRDWVPQVPFAFDLPDEMTNNPVDAYLRGRSRLMYWIVSFIEWIARRIRKWIGNEVAEGADAAESYLGSHIDSKYLEPAPVPDNTSPCLNYIQCGDLISLQGKKCEQEEDKDIFWQHHCGNYLKLMQEQLQP